MKPKIISIETQIIILISIFLIESIQSILKKLIDLSVLWSLEETHVREVMSSSPNTGDYLWRMNFNEAKKTENKVRRGRNGPFWKPITMREGLCFSQMQLSSIRSMSRVRISFHFEPTNDLFINHPNLEAFITSSFYSIIVILILIKLSQSYWQLRRN